MKREAQSDWVEVFRCNTDYEADIVRDRLDDAGIPAVVFSQRDHVFNLNVGSLAQVSVRVPQAFAEAAQRVLETSVDEADLRRAAEAGRSEPKTADQDGPDAED